MYISREKRMVEERIKKLDSKMQEYIEQGRAIGIFDDANLERVLTRLERVDFQIDNTLEGDAYTTPNRDEGTITIKINENRINNEINNGKKYFEDEVIFHELTHAVNGLYEQSTETGDAFNFKKDYLKELEKDDYSENYDLIKNYMSDEEKEKFDSYVKNEDLKLAGYGWILLDEFVSQTIAQKMVKNKYNDKNIYPIKAYNSTLSNPEYRYYSDLADYQVFTPFATSFIETLYGTKDISNFCIEALDEKFVEKIFQEFQKRPNGLEDLYKMLGYMGNIYYADGIQKGHYTEKDIKHRKAGFVKSKEKVYDSIKKFIKISEEEVNIANNKDIQKSEEVIKKAEKLESESTSKKQKDDEKKNVAQNMQSYINQLNTLIKSMATDYLNKDYSNNLKSNEQFDKLISAMVDEKIANSDKKVSSVERMMEIRRLDAIASNLVLASRAYAQDLKDKSQNVDKSGKMVEFELKELKNFLEAKEKEEKNVEGENEEAQVSTNSNTAKANKKVEAESQEDKKESNIEGENIVEDAEEGNIEEEEFDADLKIRYCAESGKYIIENTGEEIDETVLKSKKDKLAYIKENFNKEDMEYIFGKKLRKAIKKCDLQLVVILSDLNMDCAKHYVERMTKRSRKDELPYSMVYDLRAINNNPNLSFFDKIRLKRLVKKNKCKNVAEAIEDKDFEVRDYRQEALEEAEKEYRKELSNFEAREEEQVAEKKSNEQIRQRDDEELYR